MIPISVLFVGIRPSAVPPLVKNSRSALLNPYVYYYLPLLFTLSLYYARLSDTFISAFEPTALLSVAIILLIPLACHRCSSVSRNPVRCWIDFDLASVNAILFTLVLLAYVVQLAVLGPPPLLAPQDKTLYFVFGVTLFFYLSQMLIPLSLAAYRLQGGMLNLFYAAAGIGLQFTLLNKNPVIVSVLTSVICIFFLSRRPTMPMFKLAAVAALMLGLVYVMFVLNPAFRENEKYFDILKDSFGIDAIDDPILALIYMYLVSGWENFFHYIVSSDQLTYGTAFFHPVVKLIKLDAVSDLFEYHDVLVVTLQNPNLTVGTGFFRMYSDFGFVSLGLYLLIYFLSAVLLRNAFAARGRLSTLILLVNINVFLFFLFFDSYFFLTISLFNLVVFWLLTRIFGLWSKPVALGAASI